MFGSVDPSSATSTLLEVVRSYSLLLKQGRYIYATQTSVVTQVFCQHSLKSYSVVGWRPRRSLMFCSWGASEQGYMGATGFYFSNKYEPHP